MRLTTFSTDDAPRIGIATDSGVIDLSRVKPELPTEMITLLEEGDEVWQNLSGLEKQSPHFPFEEVTLHSPVLRPGKILAVGLNYHEHAVECNLQIPEYPLVFTKQRTAINSPFAPIHWSEDSQQLDYEAELAIIVGKRCRRVPEAKARSVIAGYAVANDLSVRDWQLRGQPPQFTMGKSWDTHCPLGPWLTTADSIDPHTLRMASYVNGEKRQEVTTDQMIFTVDTIISYLSTAFTLEPGDVILTGTPSGVGMMLEPPQYLSPGDTVRVEIEGLGHIENPVIAEPADTVVY